MNYPLPAATGLVAENGAQRAPELNGSDWRPRRAMPLMRSYGVAALMPDGTESEFSRLAPAHPMFEEAFSAIARGAIISTPDGGVAVEDLRPGMQILTAEDSPQTLLWIGSLTRVPLPEGSSRPTIALTRVATETFGYEKPSVDLLVGGGARLMHRNPRCQQYVGTDSAYVPISAFDDGANVFGVSPVSPVTMYHLAFARQQSFFANGVEIESYHPGNITNREQDRGMLALLLSMFPHIQRFADFGPLATPRLTRFETEEMLLAG